LIQLAMVLIVTTIVGVTAIVCVFLFGQDLRVDHTPRGTFIDVRALGEYQANVRRLRVTDVESGQVLWELQASREFFPLWLVKLQPGENPARPDDLNGADVLLPTGSTFRLEEGRRYRVDLWSYKEGMPRHVGEDFMLPKRLGA